MSDFLTGEDEEFLRDLQETFRQEAEEHLRVLSRAVVDLESAAETGDFQAPLETLYRQTHSLKGASGSVGQTAMESICQRIESVLAALKRGELSPTSEVVDSLSEAVDGLQECLASGSTQPDDAVDSLLRRLALLADSPATARTKPAAPAPPGGPVPGRPSPPATDEVAPRPEAAQPSEGTIQSQASPDASKGPAQSPSPRPGGWDGVERRTTPDRRGSTLETVRVSTSKLEGLMLQAEEFISVKIASERQAAALRELQARTEVWKQEWYQAHTSGSQERLEEFLHWNESFMEDLASSLRRLVRSAEEECRTVGPMVDDLIEGMKQVLMLPVSSLLSTFPKMVRDLGRASGKQVELAISGAEIEIDKRVIENLKDPLIHLLRNSVDHGIETPEIRRSLGKPARGLVRIAVSQLENNKIEISLSDDGSGIDVQQLREAAVREGLRTQGQVEAVDDAEALRLIFASGLSTSRVVSTVSGRGLGLAIVEEKVEQLGGSVSVETQLGKGTTFRIVVPATLATARGILAEISDWPFVMPVVGVDRVIRVHKRDVHMVENRQTIQLEGQTIPLIRMDEVLELPLKPQRSVSDYIQAVVAGHGEDRVAFAVDRIIEEQEVLVKALGPQLIRVRNIAGGTIIGSNKVVPIINISDLLQSAARSPSGKRTAMYQMTDNVRGRKAVLVVEDSITSRMLLKNLLEAAGYYVRPAVDGVDALNALREEEFDLVVTDIEMPRMDGFELTSRIRSDERLRRLPVILVTALESPEQKARGVEVGANAYLTKSSFSEGTLLETARSLL